ncbi:hypothetical protein [Burkholderia sp. Se-20378]|uniref:hypothetical protein n=1 Tax=Burkholderia sp. Se-20378 TaxID=2703899 RepID=UPI001980435F|nr:hypothetical protein [Burkholderia sp. Se-20378]MBN3770718.1 hypothetical protein [Burkholderia sp. Se-20378]
MNNLNSLELSRVEEEVQLLVSEIEAMRVIHAAQLSATRALARREALAEVLAVCNACDNSVTARKAISALLNLASQQ